MEEKKEELGIVRIDTDDMVDADVVFSKNENIINLTCDYNNTDVEDLTAPIQRIERIEKLVTSLMETCTKANIVDATIRNTVRLFAFELYGHDSEDDIEFEDLNQFITH